MKKSMILLLVLISTLVSVAFGFSMQAKDMQYMDNIESQSNSIKIYLKDSVIPNDEFYEKLLELKDKYNASFIRSDLIYHDGQRIIHKSGIFSKDFYKESDIKLEKGRFPKQSEEILATYNTGKENQVGYIKDLFNDTPLIIQPLSLLFADNAYDVNGVYTVVVHKDKEKIILSELASYLNISQETMLDPFLEIGYGEGTLFLLAIILAIILIAIFCLMCVFYPISKLKEIGIYKLHGFRLSDIWKELNLKILVIPAMFYLVSIIFQKILFPSMDISYFIRLTIVQLMVFGSSIILSLLTLFLIKKYSISSMLKGFFNFKLSLYVSYILKFIIFIGLIFTIPQMSNEVSRMIKEMKISHAYEEQSEYVTLSSFRLIQDEFQSTLLGNGEFVDKLDGLFSELSNTAEAGFVQTNWVDLEYLHGYDTVIPLNKPFLSDIQFGSMIVNENYFERLEVKGDITNEMLFHDKNLVIYAPNNMKKCEDMIEYYGKTILYQMFPDEDLNNHGINIYFYQNNNKEYFSESLQLTNEDHAFFENPIFVCLNDNYISEMKSFLNNSSISNPIRILDTDTHRKAIKEAIINNDLVLNELEFENVLTTGYKEQILISQSSSIVWIGLIVLIIFVSVLSSYYIILTILVSKKKEIFVKKILGYPLTERYKNELIYFFIIYVFALVQLILLTRSFTSMILYIMLIAIDFFVIFSMIHSKEKNHLNNILKGEE